MQLGYSEVSILDGGLTAWRNEGRPTVSGVNVPSKAFGEKVHHERNIPDVTPEELKALRESGADLLILDVRTPEEYGRFCIPGGVNVPGGDLILWADELKQKRDATVVINCAGRTRSIIGTAALRRLGSDQCAGAQERHHGLGAGGLGVGNKTGAQHAGCAVDGSRRTSDGAGGTNRRGRKNCDGFPRHSLSDALASMNKGVTYLIDVRSEAEFEAGHISGSINVPGGQAVQRADDFVAVRNAQIIFISNESARAVMAAYWYRQMGFPHVSVLQGGLRAWSENGRSIGARGVVRRAIGVRSRATVGNVCRCANSRRANQEFFDFDPRRRYESRIRIGSRARCQMDFPRLDRAQITGTIL